MLANERPCSAAMLQLPGMPTYTPVLEKSITPTILLLTRLKEERLENVPGKTCKDCPLPVGSSNDVKRGNPEKQFTPSCWRGFVERSTSVRFGEDTGIGAMQTILLLLNKAQIY